MRSSYYGIAFWQGLFFESATIDLWQGVSTVCLAELHGVCQCAAQYLLAVRTAPKCAALQSGTSWLSCVTSAAELAFTQRTLSCRTLTVLVSCCGLAICSLQVQTHACCIATCGEHARQLSSSACALRCKLRRVCRDSKGKGPGWNAKGGSGGRGHKRPPGLKEQRVLEDHALRHGAAAVHAARVLAGIAVLAREHDSCGLLQMPPQACPGLGDVAHVMLHAYTLLDTFLVVRLALRPLCCVAAVADG